MPAGRSPRRPSSCGRTSSGRPHLVGVSTAKDLELLGVLPGLAVPDHGGYSASLSAAAGSASMMSMLRWESFYALQYAVLCSYAQQTGDNSRCRQLVGSDRLVFCEDAREKWSTQTHQMLTSEKRWCERFEVQLLEESEDSLWAQQWI